MLELIVEVGLEGSPSFSQPTGNQRCKRKYSKIIRVREEGTTANEQTVRIIQAEKPMTPKPASRQPVESQDEKGNQTRA